jgi:hypothetical protein
MTVWRTGYGAPGKTYTLLGRDGKPYESAVPGAWGGHRGNKIYGRLDCATALRAIARGGPNTPRFTKSAIHAVFPVPQAVVVTMGVCPLTVSGMRRSGWLSRFAEGG